MNVIARRFAGNGNNTFSAGEFVERVLTLPDSAIPVDSDEAMARSRKAIKHHWPEFYAGNKATSVAKQHGFHVVGHGWSVTWKLPGFDEAEVAFIEAISDKPANQAVDLFNQRLASEPITQGVFA